MFDDLDAPVWGREPWPSWFTNFRPHQITAIEQIIEAFTRHDGPCVVWLDAPTGSGKTLIGEAIRRLLGARALYVCSSISLQEQFQRDFPYARVLKGRSNYPTALMPFPQYTAADCTKRGVEPCSWCPTVDECPYEQAKGEALSSPLAVLNTTYLLYEANLVGRMRNRSLVIADECDTLESELMRFIEFRVSARMLRNLGLDAPKKGVHRKTILQWINETLIPTAHKVSRKLASSSSISDIRAHIALDRLTASARTVVNALDSEHEWVRDNSEPLLMRPTRVTQYGMDVLWRHGMRWLCMSATIISPDELVDSLGCDLPWEVVRVPMTFPVENRRIHIAPVANMVAKEKEEAYPRMANAIRNVLDRHTGDSCLVHTVSYELANYLASHPTIVGTGRPIVTYHNSAGREMALSRFRSETGAILLAPSFDRGINLRDEECRVVIVAKIPFPNLGDRQISARLHQPGGQLWYTVQTIRSLVQMTGRAVRNESDWCATYILDRQFTSNIWKQRSLLPKWWSEALDREFPTYTLLKENKNVRT